MDIETNKLFQAVQTNDIKTIQDAYKNKVDLNSIMFNKWTLLFSACYNGRSKLVKILLKLGANVNNRYVYGATPLLIACWKGKVNVVNILLKMGADKHLFDDDKNEALTIATKYNHTEIVRILNQASNTKIN